ncbi:MAG: ATP-binding cassette domain-containing protein [archaeon]|nr:ATP-binding cassette domain-containing protein [archaeon]
MSTKNLSFKYPDGTLALNNINLSIKQGEKVAIMGPNGAGKSTLFSHFNGLKEPTSGQVLVDGVPISYNKKDLLKIRQKVGIVFQNPNDQLFAPTVKEDIAFGPMNLGLDYAEVENRVKEALNMVGMSEFENKTPHHLSGGQQKRVIIAGIVAMRPEIMILDEPTAGLDPHGVIQVLDILENLNKEGMSIVISSHDVEIITEFADRIILLNHGEIIATGTVEDIFSDHELLKEACLRPPKTIELMIKLKKAGIDVDIHKLNTDDACKELLKFIK